MMRFACHRKSRQGFTLLELLIVLVIFGLIMSALTQGALFARKAWNIQEQIIDKQGDLLSLQNFLRQMLQAGKGFKGDAKSLKFEGYLPHALVIPGHFDIELRASANRLILAWRPHMDGATALPDMTETELAPDISDVSFSYYFQASRRQTAGWQDQTPGTTQIPILIKIALLMSEHDPRHWPLLVVAPRIDEASMPKS